MAGIDNRKYVRTKLKADIKLSHPETGELSLHTADISDGGAFILAEGNELPSVGQSVSVQVQGIGDGEAPVVTMRVVRSDNAGIGLEFIVDKEV